MKTNSFGYPLPPKGWSKHDPQPSVWYKIRYWFQYKLWQYRVRRWWKARIAQADKEREHAARTSRGPV